MFDKNTLNFFLLFILLAVCIQTLNAQTVVPNIKSPNVASMERFGDIPVSLFTGVPDISIPLYTLNSGKISIPISLRYHPSSVKPAQHPGWVGLGWDLQSTGSISRKVNNIPDEDDYIRMGIDSRFRPFYPTSNTAINNNECGGTLVQNSNWIQLQNQYYLQFSNPSVSPELNADEFSFNFLGHSGVFYYGGPAAGWIVTSDENITVEVNSFLNRENLSTIVNSYLKPSSGYPLNVNHSRSFGEFTLTTEDGTKFTFGGQDAVELHTDYFSEYQVNITTDSWLLKKIVDSNGHEVTYTYARDYKTCNLNYYYENSFSSDVTTRPEDPTFDEMITSSASCSIWSLPDTRKIRGEMLFPIYLSKIASEKETVEFANNIVTSLRYTNLEFNSANPNPNATQRPQLTFIGENGEYVKWKKLTSIRVKDITNTTIMGYDFNYNENSSQRFSLSSLDVLPFPASSGFPKKVYEFKYNDIAALPPYNGNYTDHWGFYNGKNINGAQWIYGAKETNPLYATKGLLSELKYPTGGYSEFLWEAHQHSQKVTLKRDALEPYSGYAGGSRISEIKSFSHVGNLVSSKKYYYVKGYTSTANVNNLISSGVVNGKPLYVFQLVNRAFAPAGNPTFSTILNTSTLSVNSSANYGFAGNGSHIGYDEVVEKNMDNSYTKHYFTNYGIDINGEKHFDKMPVFTVGWKAGDDAYIPYSSLEMERGKEIGTFSYNTNNQLVKKNIVTYRNDQERFNQYTKQLTYTIIQFCVNAASQFVAGINMFNYHYYPIKNETTTYDINGNSAVTEVKELTYNLKNQLASEMNMTSVANKKLTVKYFYPYDFPNESNMGVLAAKNIINNPVKTQTFVNDIKTSERKTLYDLYSLPATEYQAYFPNAFPNIINYNIGNLEKKAEYKYDSKGNPVEIVKTNASPISYLWGYNSTLPVAKIENATQAQVAALALGNITNGLTAVQENNLRTNLPNAMITTYTHIPLVGISTITDPKGEKITYTYDAFGRLQFVKDRNGKILSENQYHYKN